ncbi:Galectin domain-containing protein [Meloidogyne graminicola]|uniref:Galectin domain-containing protein n=1 Tax=Meloidogyne graminicola TaxID=189291 RepID=A0A8T0A419_9BILA|nr:Galectin domain-containing protein [Meloidogyne graminicola]
MNKVFIIKIIFIFLFQQFCYIVFGNWNDYENEAIPVYLTDTSKIHYKINYLNTDQCMLRPGQEDHGSYGLIFEIPNDLICDYLLICYPSQLLRNNTHNGIITSIPYRLREARRVNF